MKTLIGLVVILAVATSLVPERKVVANKSLVNKLKINVPEDNETIPMGKGGFWGFSGTVEPENEPVNYEIWSLEPELLDKGKCAVKGDIFAWSFGPDWPKGTIDIKVYLKNMPAVDYYVEGLTLTDPIPLVRLKNERVTILCPFKRFRNRGVGCRG